MEKIRRVIARKKTLRGAGGKGFIVPVYTLNDQNEPEKVGDEDKRKDKFPNSGTIIIHREYYDLADFFKSNEFFLIAYEETKNFEEHNYTSCKFQSLDGNISSLRRLPLVIDSPKLSYDDEIQLPYSGQEYVFLDDEKYIYGPYSIIEEKYDKNLSEDESQEAYEDEEDIASDYNTPRISGQ